MPFKLRLKKSRRHYNVVSKNEFLVSVELLDKNIIECSLSSDSIAQECLENVCQRIGLHQSDFFGLRFASKWRRCSQRWLDLSKPLKRQLEKFAAEHNESPAQLSFSVMYYVGDVSLLFDEVTRYHYFLQLKSDIVEGRIQSNTEQAIILAGYCLQAEFGNHDPSRHTVEYLKDFPLLPKNLCLDAPNLLSQVIVTHGKMIGLVPAAAEQNYIQSAQQLDGYGVEYFPGKDANGQEVHFGVSLVGIVVRSPSADKSLTFKWSSIVNLSNQKRNVIIEHETIDSADTSASVQFQIEDSGTAKYVWRLCIRQHKFYMKTRLSVRSTDLDPAEDINNWRSISMPNLQNYVGFETVTSSSGTSYALHPAHSHQGLHGDPRSEYLAMSSGVISEVPYEEEAERLDTVEGNCLGSGSCAFDRVDLNIIPAALNDACNVDGLCDLHRMQQWREQQQLSAEQLSFKAQRLPTYRPAPDYDTAVRKYGTVQNVPQVPSHLTQMTRMVSSSNGVLTENPSIAKSYSHYKNFADLSLADVERKPESGIDAFRGQLQSAVGTSSYDQLVHLISRLRPPPPYPYGSGQRASASTPDLTGDNMLREHTNLSDVNSRSVAVVGISGDRLSSSPGHDVKRDDRSVSPGFEFVRPSLPSTVSSLDSKRSRPKDVRSRSSTQSAPEPSCSTSHADCIVSDTYVEVSSQNSAIGVSLMNGGGEVGIDQLCKSAGDARCSVFLRKLSEGSVFAEFAAIPRRRPIRGPIDFDCATSLLPENVSRNRFAVFPYDDNRVHLTPTVDNRHGYVNASHISMDVGGGLERRSFVAAQGPHDLTTAVDFWQMIWELDTRIIVMLTDVRKCFQYWPCDESPDGNANLKFGDFYVFRRFGTKSTSFVTSSLVVRHASFPKRTRNVWHIQYLDWPDHGCPDVDGFLSFMDEIESVRRHDRDGRPAGSMPIVVHCRAGVGRSGVTILCNLMIYALDHNLDLDVPKVLAHLRNQRMVMVQTLAQYKFVYTVLVQYLRNARLI